MAFQADFSRDGSGPRFGTQKLLLVEDSRMFSAVLCHRFQAELGLNVKPCSSLKALRRLWRRTVRASRWPSSI